MGDTVRLVTAGTLDLEAVRALFEEESERPAELGPLRHIYPDPDDFSFEINFKDPFDRRRDRQIRGHRSTSIKEPHAEFVGDGEYTYLALADYGNAEKIVTMIAERFGGHLYVDAREEGFWFDVPATTPTV